MTAKNQTTENRVETVHLEKAGICIPGKWREIEKSSQKSIVSTKNALLNQ